MNRPLLRETTTIVYRPMIMMETRELPSQRRSLWTLTTSLMAGTAAGLIHGEPPVAPRPRPSHPSVREIHKNAWLKRQACVDKKAAHFGKKLEKLWVVFCVHDDSEAFLEFYAEPKMGTLHKPLSAVSLNHCLHVSPSIVPGQDNEYQFAVTLQTEVIRLVAANWEQMIEWVESLQGKLREMNILSPKDNLYSKLPEAPPPPKIIIGPVASTRDPNSPLPPTPMGAAGGGGSAQAASGSSGRAASSQSTSGGARDRRSGDGSSAATSSHQSHHSSRVPVNGNASSSSAHHRHHHHNHNDRHSSRGSNHLLVDLSERAHARAQQLSTSPTPPASATSSSGEASIGGAEGNASQPAPNKRKPPKISVKVNVDVVQSNGGGSRSTRQQNGASTSATTTVVVIGNGDLRVQNNGDASRREVTASSSSSLATSVVVNGSNGDLAAAAAAGREQETQGPETNCVSRVAVNGVQVVKPAVTVTSGENNGDLLVSIDSAVESRVSSKIKPAAPMASSAGKRSCSSENIYEHIYIPDSRPAAGAGERTNTVHQSSNNGVKCNNGNNHHHHQQQQQHSAKTRSQRTPEQDASAARDAHARRLIKTHNGGGNLRSSSLSRIEVPTPATASGRSDRPPEPPSRDARRNGNRNNHHGHGDEMSRSVGNSTFFANGDMVVASPPIHHLPAAPPQLQGIPLDALIGSRNGEYLLRRDEYLIRSSAGETSSSSSGSDNDNHPYVNSDVSMNGGSLPLKEQQVMHLQMEINHPGGVRVILRKKDCLSSIAFVDYLGAVWIAGWKQQQYPVLYYGFHVGDQILKVAGVNVQSSVEASRAIKMVSSMQVEFIIRRLPYGKVYAIKRTREGEPLGLVAEGGSGEISEVLPDGLAARYGLPPKGLSVDGQSPCNWYLTEINNRPLSLMSKENEVKDRLNAVGKEISILVQPADLVKHMRKSLKSYKGFKDYVVG